MNHLLHTLQERLAGLPVRLVIELPGGQRLGPSHPDVTLRIQDRLALGACAAEHFAG